MFSSPSIFEIIFKMKKVISKLRIKKTGQKQVNVPKQKETEDWEEHDLIELKKVEVK